MIKLLVGFFASALILTYISIQIYNATLPVVQTAKSYSAKLRAVADVTGKVIYEETVSHIAPVDAVIEKIFVKPGQRIAVDQMLLKLDVETLDIEREQLQNQILQLESDSESSKYSETVLLLQIEIAERELAMFQTNSQLKTLIDDKRYEADVLEHQENVEITNMQLALAETALRDYQLKCNSSDEEIPLIRAIEKIRLQLSYPDLTAERRTELEQQLRAAEIDLQVCRAIPSNATTGYDLSQELNMKLAVLQAKNNLLASYYNYPDERNSAQARYEASLQEYEQSQQKNAVQMEIDQKKLELSIMQYKQQLEEQRKLGKSKLDKSAEVKEKKRILSEVDKLIKDKGLVRSKQNGEITEINVEADRRITAESNMVTICALNKSAYVRWYTDNDNFDVTDAVTADLKVFEIMMLTSNGEQKEKTFEKEVSVKLPITSRRYIVSDDMFEYTAQIPIETEGEEAAESDDESETLRLAMSNNQSVKVALNKSLDEYETVIPVAAISFIDEHKGTVFCVTKNSQDKPIAMSVEVEVVDYDDTNAALKEELKDKVIVYSDRPLASEGVIRENE